VGRVRRDLGPGSSELTVHQNVGSRSLRDAPILMNRGRLDRWSGHRWVDRRVLV